MSQFTARCNVLHDINCLYDTTARCNVLITLVTWAYCAVCEWSVLLIIMFDLTSARPLLPPHPLVLRQIINDDVYRIREPADGQTDGRTDRQTDRQTDGQFTHLPSLFPSFLPSIFFTVLHEDLLTKQHSACQCELPMAVTAVWRRVVW